jgi:hypothetical protein
MGGWVRFSATDQKLACTDEKLASASTIILLIENWISPNCLFGHGNSIGMDFVEELSTAP